MKAPTFLSDPRAYCEKYADQIFIRETIDGKVGSYSLSQLSPEKREAQIARWEGYAKKGAAA